MPWSTALRTRWVSGSLTASRIVLSSSVSRPSISRRTGLPQAAPRSRTTRGSLVQRLSIGCMRVFMTTSCSSLVMRFSRADARTSVASPAVAAWATIWLRVRTSSPTRRISESSRSTSTRMLPSATERRSAWTSSASDTSPGVVEPWLTRISPIGRGSPTSCAVMARRRSSPVAPPCSTMTSPTGGDDGVAGGRCCCSAGAAAPPCCSRIRVAISSLWSASPSRPVASIAASRERMASTIVSSAPVISAVSRSSPSRSLLSRLSPAWVSASRRPNSRKPVVPLMVWMVRKMAPSSCREVGSCSRATRSLSSWSRFSWLSTRNSATISSRSSNRSSWGGVGRSVSCGGRPRGPGRPRPPRPHGCGRSASPRTSPRRRTGPESRRRRSGWRRSRH